MTEPPPKGEISLKKEIEEVLEELRKELDDSLEKNLKSLEKYRKIGIETLNDQEFKELCDRCTELALLIDGLLPQEEFRKKVDKNREVILDVLSRVTKRAIKIEEKSLQNLLHNKEIVKTLVPQGSLSYEDIIIPLSSAAMFEVLIELGKEKLKEDGAVREALVSLLKFLTDDRIISKDLGFYDVIYFNINGIRPVLHDLTTTSAVFLAFCGYYNEILSNKDVFGEDLAEKVRSCVAKMVSGVIRLIDHCIRESPETSEWMTYFITKDEVNDLEIKTGKQITEIVSRFDRRLDDLKEQTEWITKVSETRGLYNLLNIITMLFVFKELFHSLNEDEAEKLEKEIKARCSMESVENELDAILAFLYGRLKRKMYRLLEEVREKKLKDILEKLEEDTLLPKYDPERQRIGIEDDTRSFIPYLARLLIMIYDILGKMVENKDIRISYQSLLREEDIQTLYALLGWAARLLRETYRYRREKGKKMFAIDLAGGDEYDISGIIYCMLDTYHKYFDSIERVFFGSPEEYLKKIIGEKKEEERQPLEVMIRPLEVKEKRGRFEVIVTDREDPSYYKELDDIVINIGGYSEYFERPARDVNIFCSRLRSGKIDSITTEDAGNLHKFHTCLDYFNVHRGDGFIGGKHAIELEKILSQGSKPIIIKLPSPEELSSPEDRRSQLWSHRFLWELIKIGNEHIGIGFPVGRVIPSEQRRELYREEEEEDVIRVLLVRGSGAEEDEKIFNEEIEYLEKLFKRIRSKGYYITVEVARSWGELDNKIAHGKWDILHYAGHTAYKKDSGWVWEFEDGKFKVDALPEMQAPSLVFSNSCESARIEGGYGEEGKTGMSVENEEGYGGHVQFPAMGFLRMGTRAYIGTLFPLESGLALEFCKKFYEELLQEKKSVGESLRLAREEIRKSKHIDELTNKLREKGMKTKEALTTIYACYVLYGDPLYRLVR